MNKFWIILSHTYMTRVKTKAFIITTAITLMIIIGLGNIDSIIKLFANDEADEVLVIDDSKELLPLLDESMEQVNDKVDLIPFEGDESKGKKEVENEEYKGLLVLSSDEDGFPVASFYANNITENGIYTEIENQIQQIKIAMATSDAGIDQETLASIYAPVEFQTIALDKSAKTDEELNQARGIVYVMLFVLYMAILLYGQMIATDVATEKSSRVMEILISSATPVTHMFAKIFGVALLGLTQVGLSIGTGYAVIVSRQDELSSLFGDFGFQNASVSIYIYAIVFFILGYLLYATLAAMLGSLVSRVEDVSQLLLPMTFLIMIAFFIAIFGLSMPESKLVVISSFIPFFSPMLMFLRVGMLDIPIWEIGLSIGILIGTTVLLGLIGARVYKGGVLMYGRSSSLKDFKKALALSKKE